MRFRIRCSFCCFVALLLCLTAPQLLAQSTQSTILGTVKDTTGAVIPNAEVVVTNIDKGLSMAYRTDGSGNYQALELIPGTYKVQVAKAGFETPLIEGLQLTARQQLRVDVTLAVGRAQQEVTVNAESAGAIETETASISASLNAENVANLPVNYYGTGTSPVNALQVLPGVQSDTASGIPSPTANGTPNTNFSVQGGQPSQTEASVDGISTQNVRTNTPLLDAFPSAESISEIRVDGVNNNAEFGQAGEITTITKSGANKFHGAAFWHFQNSALDAKAFGEPTKPAKNGNDFGVSVGGPVRRDKTFFFGTYEGFLFPKQSAVNDLVPTADMLTGNFSVEFPTYPLINPATESCYFSTGNPLCGAYLSPFNEITTINASAKPFLPLFPTGGANYGGSPTATPYATIAEAEAGAGYNYTQNRASDYNSKQFDARIDQRFSPKMLAFARFTFKDLTLLEPQDLNIASITQFDNYRILASSLIYNFTPNLLNEFRFGWTSEENGLRNTLNGAPYTTSAGFDAVSSSIPVNNTTGTEVYFTGDMTSLLAGNINQTTQSHLFQYNDNLTWVKGRHTVKFGGDIRALNFVSTLGDNGLNTAEVFPFYGLYTSAYQGAFFGLPEGTLSSTAYQFADFLTGAPVETKYFSLVPRDEGATLYYAAFAQDQWRITPELTFSFGVRYEYDPAMHDITGTIGNFDPSVASTGAVIYPAGYSNMLDAPYLAQFDACGYGPASTAYAACTPVLSSSQAGLPSGLRKAQKDRILPRIGLAWRPFNDDKTAVRAGFGLYNTTLLGDSFFAMTDTLQSATLTYNNLQGYPYYPPYLWPQTSPGSSLPAVQYGTASFTSANQINWKNPYSIQWNLSIDHELRGNLGVRISYIGMRTDDLVWAANENDMPYSSTTKALSQPLTNRPFPNWQAINDRLTGAQAFYSALQAEANRRFQHGLTFQSTYTWSKNLADNQGTQATGFVGENGNYASYIHNLKLDYGNVYGTRRQRWITTGVYELPVGRGRSFGANMNRTEDALIGGWQLSSIFVLQTGPYMTAYIPGGDADPSGTGSGVLYALNQRPDRVAGQSAVPANRTRSQWLNPMAFACPSNSGYTSSSYAGNTCGVGYTSNPIGRFGNESVGDIVGPGTVNWSAGLSKRIEITSNVHLRAEGTFTNVLNHTNLNDPNLNIESPLFGKITSNRGSDFGGGRTGQVSLKLEF